MALVLADRVRDTTTTTGTGTVTLSGTAPTGYQNFSVVGNGNTTYYTINAASQWEVGIGTYSSTGPTLARTTVLASSNGGALVNFSAGTKDVFLTYPAEKSVNYDAANNVGIGTTSPNYKLDVVGDVGMGGVLTTGTGVTTGGARIELGGNRTGDGNSYIDFHSAAGTDFEARMLRGPGANGDLEIANMGTGTFTINAAGAAPLRLSTNGTERVRITSAGDVGIGTSTPATALDVATGFIQLSSGATARAKLFADASVTYLTSEGARALTFSTNSAERVRITSGGAVGIGTNNPVAALEVVGTSGYGNIINVRNSSTSQFSLGGVSLLNSATANNFSVTIGTGIRDADGTDSYFVMFKATSGSAYVASLAEYDLSAEYWRFFTNGSERVRIDSSGNFGIGTSTPGAKLDVSGTTLTGNITVRGDGVEGGQITFNNLGNTAGPLTLDVDGSGNGRLFTTVNNANLTIGQLVGTGGVVTFVTSGSERVRVDTGGNVNIGAQAATAAGNLRYLDIYNTENTNGASGTDIRLITQNAAGSGLTTLDLIKYKSGAFYIANAETGSGGIIGFSTSSTERMRITSGGDVGIGTSSPATKLNVIGDIQLSRSTTASDAAINFGSNTNNYIYSGNSNNIMAFATNGSERVRITSGGDVGIGSSAPPTRLFVETPINVGASFAFSSNANGAYPPSVFGGSFGYNFSAGGAEVDFWNGWTGASGTQGGFTFRRQTGASSQNLLMLIRGDGNVGIGVGNPSSKLDVKNSGDAIEVYPSGTWAGRIINAADAAGFNGLVVGNRWASTNSWVVDFGSIYGGGTGSWSSYYKIDGLGQSIWGSGASGAERMRLDTSGNVGIGTSSPGGYRLNVNGTLFTSSNVQFYSQDGFRFTSASAITAMRFGSSFTGESTAEWAYNRGAGVTTLSVGNSGSALNERLRVDSSGNLAVGTSTTNARFRVAAGGSVNAPTLGTVSNYPAFFSNADTGYGFGIGTNSVDGHVWLQAQRSDSAVAYNLTLNEAGGNVGIGTASPPAALSVLRNTSTATVAASSSIVLTNKNTAINGTIAGGIFIDTYRDVADPHYSGGIWFTRNQTSGNLASGSDIVFGAQDNNTSGSLPSEDMRIVGSSGNVGIGTASPGNRLTVVGGTIQQYKASGDNNAFYGSTSDTSNNYLRLQNSVNTVDLTCSNGSAYLNSAQGVLWFGTNGAERMRLSGSELLVGTTTGGRTVCIYSTDNWMRMHNPSRSWLIGPSIGSNFNIWDETGGYNVAYFDTAGSFNLRNSMYIGSGQNLDNKIEIGSGRTGNNYAYVDLIGDTTYTDYGLRMIRGNGGPNTTSQIDHRGTGAFYIGAQDAANVIFQTSNSERFRVEATGAVSFSANSLIVGRNSASTDVNTANDTGSISIRGSTTTVAVMSFHRAGAYAINMGLGTDNVFRIGGWSASSNCFQMDGSGNLTMLGNVTAYSDARLKKDVETIGGALDLVSKMRGVRYTRTDTEKRGVGVIAQEMLEVLPEVVQQGIGDDDTLSVAYGNLVGVLIEAVKELTARVAELEGK